MALGGLFSILTFLHDVRRIGLPPQGAPKRVPPEIHAFSALLTGAGTMVPWTWVSASLVFIGHAPGAYFVAMPLIERFAPSGRQETF
jgi:hypothetical protein